MSAAGLHVRHEGATTYLTLARPERRNALHVPLLQALVDALAALPADCRVVQLAGEGSSFCAGADVRWMQQAGQDAAAANLASSQLLAQLFAALHSCDRAIVAVVHGPVRGGGCGLLAAADVVLAEAGSNFAFTEVRLGLIPATIAPSVARRLGWARAQTMFLTAETFDAHRALALGLVDEVVDADALVARATALRTALAAGGPAARTALKQLLRQLPHLPPAAAAAEAAAALAKVRAGAEAQEGFAAFLARRAPAWQRGGAP